MQQPTSEEVNKKRATFFRVLFGELEGYLCIARRQSDATGGLQQEFFKYPDQLPELLDHIERYVPSHNLWYCPHLFNKKARKKEYVEHTPCAWADLDECHPNVLQVPPTIVIESSPKRYQALWLFDKSVDPVDPSDAEDISQRIAYAHKDDGADRSGWDLTQLLRVPFSYNFKHQSPIYGVPLVAIISVNDVRHQLGSFSVYPQAEGYDFVDVPLPELNGTSASDILELNRYRIAEHTFKIFAEVPELNKWKEGWSGALWALIMQLLEAGLSDEEVFVVVREAACNKYRRDGHNQITGDKLLWKDVQRAAQRIEERNKVFIPAVSEPTADPLLSDEERKWCEANPSFVEEYVTWAKTVGDAAWQYHQAGGFVALSSLLAGTVRLPTSYGMVVPNLWFMILADTTLTRKTTAMDLALDLIGEVDSDAVLATDGSIEGLFTSLSTRPGRPSIFLRDEFSGLLEAITKKDYYAGMAETLTKLYDGKFQKRVLRKETVELRDPVLILFAGGIKTRTLALLNYEHVASGFLPRFIFITAESNVAGLRPLGPPTKAVLEGRERIIDKMRDMQRHYHTVQTVKVGERQVAMPKRWDAELSAGAWQRYNQYEEQMLKLGLASQNRDILTPMMDRLAKSGLKAAVLLAAARQRNENLLVQDEDIVRAFYYVEQWRPHALEVVLNLGKNSTERTIDLVGSLVQREPGIWRSQVMQRYHLLARDADIVLGTLEQRGLINRKRNGKSEQLYPVNA